MKIDVQAHLFSIKLKSFFLIMAGPGEDTAYLAEHIKNREKQD
jgi:hypothetical protein